MAARHDRAAAVLRAAGADALLAADPSTVAWLTGLATGIETGPSPFALGPYAVLQADGTTVLVASEDEDVPVGVDVVRFPGFGIGPLDLLGHARAALHPLVTGRRLAVEAASVPAGLATGAWIDLGAALRAARAVKDPDELAALRAAIALCDVGQAALRSALEPGVSELELWSALRAAIEEHAGGRVALLADLVSGPRTADVGGDPSPRRMVEGELVICDLVPRLGGVWGDSCATVAAGAPPPAAVERHRRCLDALDAAIDAVRPGARADDLDRLVRERLGQPHHTGHGIGFAQHELPRLVPDSPDVLEEGMVIAIEPGAYGDGFGVRVERVVAVTADGCDLLSGHDLSL